MKPIAWVLIMMAACDSTSSLTYDVKTKDTAESGLATFADVANLAPSVEVKGTAGDYLDAIRTTVAAQKEPAQVTVTVAGNEPNKKSEHLDIAVTVDALWWTLPDATKAHADLTIKLDYRSTTKADVGKKVGEIVVHYLDSRRPKHAAVPTLAPPATAIAVGRSIACTLHTDHSVHCWGQQIEPLVGDVPSKTPIANAVEIAAGDDSMCARLESGDVKCIGKIDSIDQGKDHKPAKVCDLDKPSKLAVGADSACALVDGGKIRCWNPNVLDSQQGTCSHASAEVKGIAGATTLAAGTHTMCALVAGKAACWPTKGDPVVKQTALTGVDVVPSYGACVLDAAGELVCEKNGSNLSAKKFPPGSKVALDAIYGCALTPTAQLQCFGVTPDDMFDLVRPADAKSNDRAPTPVLENVLSFGIGIDIVCVVTKDGAVSCASEHSNTEPGLAAPSPKLTKLAIY